MSRFTLTAISLISVISVGLLASSSAQASDDLPARCADMANNGARLDCYDGWWRASNKSGNAPVADASSPSAGQSAGGGKFSGAGVFGKWHVTTDTNPLDDTKTVTAVNVAEAGHGTMGGKVSLIARCMSNKTEVYINWSSYLGNDGGIYDDYKNVTLRIGSEKAQTRHWGLSTDTEATFSPGWAGTLLKQMAGERSLVAQVIPYNERPIVAQFDLTGLDKAIQPISETCHWQ